MLPFHQEIELMSNLLPDSLSHTWVHQRWFSTE